MNVFRKCVAFFSRFFKPSPDKTVVRVLRLKNLSSCLCRGVGLVLIVGAFGNNLIRIAYLFCARRSMGKSLYHQCLKMPTIERLRVNESEWGITPQLYTV